MPPLVSVVLVALRKESVDRNAAGDLVQNDFERSLSARRAWIEISTPTAPPTTATVALRKESVDRNVALLYTAPFQPESLSARRAWIEMV